MEDLLTVPRDVLQRAYDALEEHHDWCVVGTDTWTLYQQLSCILYPDAPRTPAETLKAFDVRRFRSFRFP